MASSALHRLGAHLKVDVFPFSSTIMFLNNCSPVQIVTLYSDADEWHDHFFFALLRMTAGYVVMCTSSLHVTYVGYTVDSLVFTDDPDARGIVM